MMRRRVLLGGIFTLSVTPHHALSQDGGTRDMRIVETRGVHIATQAFGSPANPALVLIMGATASMLSWPDAFCHALAEHSLYVIRFDHRDTGRSTTVPPGAALYAVEDLAEDVIGIMDAYELKRVHVLGMSLGGYLAQMLALEHPDRVQSLTLIGSEPLGWDGPSLPHISEAFLRHFAGLEHLDWADEKAVTDFLLTSERLSAGSGEPFDETAMRARIAQIFKRTDSPASMFNHATLDARRDWTGRFRDISVPVLVLHGEEDPILPVANGQAIADGIEGAELFVLPGVGHELPPAQHRRMAKIISDHLPR